ncbi:MAG: Uma2 family endonuclease [Lewinellaceae bacterium]|nr:Uma2 family endonuclease [Lewinellaceae bacterium]
MKLEELSLNKIYTYADYLTWTFEETVELIKGKIFKMSPAPNTYHQEISCNMILKIGYFLGKKECKVFHAPFDVRLPLPPGRVKDEEIQTVVQPDISIICDLSKLDAKGCLGAPDWIIEIASPSTSKKDRKDKFEVYEHSGVKEYWMVFPEEQYVLAYALNEEGKYIGRPPFNKEDKISPVLFPNLVIDLQDIFPERNLAEAPWDEHYIRM